VLDVKGTGYVDLNAFFELIRCANAMRLTSGTTGHGLRDRRKSLVRRDSFQGFEPPPSLPPAPSPAAAAGASEVIFVSGKKISVDGEEMAKSNHLSGEFNSSSTASSSSTSFSISSPLPDI